MARIIENQVVITLSTLVKDSDADPQLVDRDFISNIEAVVQELVDKNVVVEVKESE